jgi:hypothetical protein
MKHPVQRVTAFQIVGDYTLRIEFGDAHVEVVDFLDVLRGVLFGPLTNLELFNAVRLDTESHTLVWPNGADFDPAVLHDWPQREAAMKALARGW